MDYITILSIISFCIIFSSHVTPWEWIKEKYINNLFSFNIVVNTFLKGFKKLLNCAGCQSFWISLIVLKDLELSLIIYCVTYYLSSRINSIEL